MTMELFTENLENTFKDRKKYNNLARIAAQTFSAPACAISLRLADKFILIGRQGLDRREFPRTFELGEFADAPLWIEDMQQESDPRVKPLIQPLTEADGPIRFFSSSPIVDKRFNRIGLVAVFDYTARFPDKRLARVLELIADTVREILFFSRRPWVNSENSGWIDLTPDKPALLQAGEFGEDSAKARQSGLSITEKFLFDTLIARQSVISRNGVSYLSLRAWRSSVKKHQIHALREVKAAPTPAFVETVAREIVSDLARFAGSQSVRIIGHIPCGHSRKPDCLSCLLAKEIAAQLNLPFVSIFKPNFSDGTSHPKANLIRPAMEIDTPVRDPVLLIDDVASSGRHIEEAVGLLRQTADRVLPVTWIGGHASTAHQIVSRLTEVAKIKVKRDKD